MKQVSHKQQAYHVDDDSQKVYEAVAAAAAAAAVLVAARAHSPQMNEPRMTK